MASDAGNAEDLASIRNLQYIVPQKQTLYLESKLEPQDAERSLAHLWRTQSILVMAHIFEALDHIEVIVAPGSEVEIDGKKLEKPVLVVHRDPAKANQISPAYEVISDIVQIICEHFYKFYIFTHLIEKREDRVARPVVSGELEAAEADPSTWIVQPKNSNVLVRSLRGKRKVALQLLPMVEHALGKTNMQVSQTVSMAANPDPKSPPIWLPSDVVILGRKLRLGPFTGAKHITILDFVTLAQIRPYLQALERYDQIKTLAPGLSILLEWVHRIQNVKEWKNAISLDQGYARYEHLAQFADDSIFDVASILPSGVTPVDFKANQEKIKGPRCNWTTNKMRNHHLVKTPYESLLTKLDAAQIVIPDHTWRPDAEMVKIDTGHGSIEVHAKPDEGITETIVPWALLPEQLDPANGCLVPDRALRKRQQISNIIHYVSRLVRDGQEIVDFCGGGGHISLVLAWLYPQTHVTLIDRNEVSLALATKRRTELGLTNMDIVCSDVQLWKPSHFDIGVAIHACGSLSDIIMEKCIEMKASYVMAPCCFGGLQNADTTVTCLPRSQRYAQAGVTVEDYMSLASVADVNTSAVSLESPQYLTGKKAMAIIDHDRNLRASQDGYSTFQFTMRPPTCSPKNEIICGIASGDVRSADYFNQAVDGVTVRRPIETA